MPLTDLSIRKMKPEGKRYEVKDVDGLYLRISPSGKKSWHFRYFLDGKQRRISIGRFPAVSLSEAREKYAQARQDVEKGTDPGKKAQEDRARKKADPSFKDLLDEFWEQELSHSPTAQERRRLVEKDALPAWTARKVSGIRRRDAVVLLDAVRERAPVTANRLQGVLVRMFNFASERGILEASPLTGMRRGKESTRSRVLSNEEIKGLWNALDLERKEIDIFRLTKLALKAILLTGQRPGEVTGMKWAQVDGEWWIIPAEERKNREENRVPVLPMFAEILEQAKAHAGDSEHVFPSSHREDRPLRGQTLANAVLRHSSEFGIAERFTPHDLRRTMRTRLAELGVSDVVAERVLGHKLQGLLAVYNRHSYDVEKRHALGLWEQRLREILGSADLGTNVIPFEVSRHAHQ